MPALDSSATLHFVTPFPDNRENTEYVCLFNEGLLGGGGVWDRHAS
jgi:hypothetical protein